MFLAINEIRQAKVRYGLILGLLFLIAYLVFFLVGLANGLAGLNRSAIDNWQADQILLAKDSNQNLTLSNLELELTEQVDADKLASLAQKATVAWNKSNPKEDDKVRTTLLAIEAESFIAPKILEGRSFEKVGDLVISERLAEEEGFAIGDRVWLLRTDQPLKVVGITGEASYSVAPVIYTSLETYSSLQGEQGSQSPETINALLLKGELSSYPKDELDVLPISDFISNLPGYRAQLLTFGFMIGFLVLIAAIIIGIFMYILTMQKIHIFGVMKTQGISTAYIAKSVLAQTFLLTIGGTVLALLANWGSALLLPSKVPFQISWSFNLAVSAGLILIALMGSLFSVRVVAKIDPLQTIN